MKTLKRIGGMTLCLMAITVLSPASPAFALDVWQDTGFILDGATGTRACTTSATISNTATTVTARGSITCTKSYDELEVQVCIQVQQPLVDEGATWKDYACAPPVVRAGSSASNSVTSSCLPGTWDYRAKVVVGGYRGNETPFTSIGVSSPRRLTCLV